MKPSAGKAFPKSLLRLAIQEDHKDDCAWMPLAVSSNMKSSANVRGRVVKVAEQGACKAACRLFSCPDRIIGKDRQAIPHVSLLPTRSRLIRTITSHCNIKVMTRLLKLEPSPHSG